MRARRELPVAHRLLVALAVAAPLAAASAASATELLLTAAARDGGPLRPGGAARLEVAVRDAVGAAPVPGLHLRGWLRPADSAARTGCAAAARRYLRSGRVGPGELALEGTRLVTVDAEGTVGAIDPRLDLATANLVGVTRLGAEAGALLPLPDLALVALSLPAQDELALLDAATGSLHRRVALPPGSAPTAVAPLRDKLWVALPGAGALAVVDPTAGSLQSTVPLATEGRPRALAVDAEDAWLLALDEEGAVHLVDGLSRRVVASSAEAAGATALAHVRLARMAYRLAGRRVTAFLVPGLEAIREIDLPFAAERLAASPDGRWLFAVGSAAGQVAVVDVAANRVRHLVPAPEHPEEVAFSGGVAWLRLRDSAKVRLVHLAALSAEEGAPVNEVAAGAAPPGAARLPLLAPLAGGHGGSAVLAANPGNRVAYLLSAGMQAPVTALPVKSGSPAGLAVLELGFRETDRPGLYAAHLAVPGPGDWELVVWLERAQEARCLPLGIEGPASAVAATAPAARIESRLPEGPLPAGAPVPLRFALLGLPEGAAPVAALGVLVLDPRTGWHWRGRARPAPDGLYAAEVSFPRPGRYRVLADAPELGLRFEDAPLMLAEVGGRP